MDVATRAVALRATDYKENDKLVLLYSLEFGKISIHAKGVRKAGAKLRFACDQFCFGEYELVQNADHFTLKTCHQLESFYALREDLVAYYAACVCADALITCTDDGQCEPPVFVLLLHSLQQLVYGTEPLLVALKFLLDFLVLQGLRLNPDGDETTPPLPQPVASVCKLLYGLPHTKLKNVSVPLALLKDALVACNHHIAHTYAPLKTVNELVRL